MKETELGPYLERLETAFHTAFQKLGTNMASEMKTDLTGPQFFLLRLLNSKGIMTASELARALSVKPGAVTAMIDRMYKNKLVERKRDEMDRRVVFISISDEGRRIYENAERNRKKIMSHYLSHFDKEELETLIRLYEKLANVMTRVDLTEEEDAE